ncbi:MAG TPA: NnrS family protein, partial [Terriglobia bacterium]|nr:NnrS family protein [Terriglobia bacterium]
MSPGVSFQPGVKTAGLPEAWRAAYERDRLSAGDYADPEPERRAARALAAFIASGLAFLALPGTLLGVWNLIEIASHRAASAASVAWIQAHGQAQLLGWVGSFILGISLYALPKFQHRSLRNFGLVWTVWALWTMGVAWRWWVGVSVRGWRFGLIASAIMELAAYALTQRILLFSQERSGEGKGSRRKPTDLGSWLGIVGFGALGLALTFNLGISILVALKAATPAYPPRLDRAFLIVELWGFTVPIAWGYSTRFVTIFLGLHPPDHGAARRLGVGIVAIIVCALAQWFLLADFLILIVTIMAIHALRVLQPAVQPPKLAGVYRLYPQFIRLSYAWLLVGAALGVAADIWGKEAGLSGASRHAVTVGFVATLIFALAPRLLPAFLRGRELYSGRLMAASLWTLSVGCLLRVSSEAIAYSAGGWAWHIL